MQPEALGDGATRNSSLCHLGRVLVSVFVLSSRVQIRQNRNRFDLQGRSLR